MPTNKICSECKWFDDLGDPHYMYHNDIGPSSRVRCSYDGYCRVTANTLTKYREDWCGQFCNAKEEEDLKQELRDGIEMMKKLFTKEGKTDD